MTPLLRLFLAGLGLLVGVAVLCIRAEAEEPDTTTVTWQHPDQYTDDSPLGLNDLAATQLEYGPCPPAAGETKIIEIAAPVRYAKDIPLPTPGLWCIRLRTRDQAGEWSEWTDAVIRESPLMPYTGILLPPFKLVM